MEHAPYRIVYSPFYEVDIGTHVFLTSKFRLIRERLIKTYGFSERDFIEAPPASDEDILLVHKPEYLQKLRENRLSATEILRLEIPPSPGLFKASVICVGGTILGAKIALEQGVGVHLGGGFHHAFPGHGEGFCVFNDPACAIKRLQKDGLIKRALIIDCDLHHGNGTAYIFRDDPNVFTFSIHQQNNYPGIKPPSDLDIGLDDGTGDEEYLAKLSDTIPNIIQRFKPDFIMYVAGADPYQDDKLGGLSLTMEGLKERDRRVFAWARRQNIPVSMVLAGGYAQRFEDTIAIQTTTVLEALGNI